MHRPLHSCLRSSMCTVSPFMSSSICTVSPFLFRPPPISSCLCPFLLSTIPNAALTLSDPTASFHSFFQGYVQVPTSVRQTTTQERACDFLIAVLSCRGSVVADSSRCALPNEDVEHCGGKRGRETKTKKSASVSLLLDITMALACCCRPPR